MCYITSMLFIRKLIWDRWNTNHIAKHNITPEEVEGICHNSPLIFQGQQKGRLVLIGVTEENRMLSVVLEAKRRGKYYPITAYEPDPSDKKLYARLKGGEDNEENK